MVQTAQFQRLCDWLFVTVPLLLGLVATGAQAARMKIVAFGDSLVAGYGLKPSDGFTAQLEAALKARGHNVEIVNSGVAGDTAKSGLDRFDWAIPEDANAVILELGANDGLQGKDPSDLKATLEQIMDRLSQRKLPVLIAGMRAPRNWGESYTNAFDAVYPALSEKYGALLYPFFLEGVAIERDLNQGDGIHPNAKGVAEIVKRITPKVEDLIAKSVASK